MLTAEEKGYLDDLYCITGIPMLIVTGNDRSEEVISDNLQRLFQKKFIIKVIDVLKRTKSTNHVVLYFIDEYYYIGAVELNKQSFLFTFIICTENGRDRSSSSLKDVIAYDNIAIFSKMLDQISNTECARIYKICSFAYRCINGKEIGSEIIEFKDNIDAEKMTEIVRIRNDAEMPVLLNQSDLMNNYELMSLDTQPKESRRRLPLFEERISEAIEDGDSKLLMRTLDRPAYGYQSLMSRCELQQQKYHFVVMAHIFCNAAISGGAPMEYSHQVADKYCLKADESISVVAIMMLIKKMGTDFCNIVSRFILAKKYSKYTQDVCKYISDHIFDEISMTQVEEAVHLNRRSLRLYFKRDTGVGIPEYICKKRLEEANYLLESTNYPLATISESLHFSSQSYFGKKYKELYGITPKLYRDKTNLNRIIES